MNAARPLFIPRATPSKALSTYSMCGLQRRGTAKLASRDMVTLDRCAGSICYGYTVVGFTSEQICTL